MITMVPTFGLCPELHILFLYYWGISERELKASVDWWWSHHF